MRLRARVGLVGGLLLLIGLLVPALASGGNPARAATTSSPYIGTNGTELTLNGQNITFVGYNNYRLTSMPGGYVCDSGRGGQGGTFTEAQIQSLFQHMKSTAGTTVVRTWFFQSYYQQAQSAFGNPWAPFDQVLQAAAATGVKIIPVLMNNYGNCELNGSQRSTGYYQTAYNSPGYGYNLSFKQYAQTVAAHYASNTSIVFWQIANEIDPSYCNSSNEAQTASDIAKFAGDVGGAIHSADGNHLVSLGTTGSGCGSLGTDYQTVHNVPAINICEYHDYNQVTQAMPSGTNGTGNGLQDRLNECKALNKPLFVGEAGIPADVTSSGSETGTINASTLSTRATLFNAKLKAAYAAGVSGYLAWEGIAEGSDNSVNLNDGQPPFGIGSPLVNGGGADPVEAVFKSYSGIAPVPIGGTGGGGGTSPGTCTAQPLMPAREDFEDGTTDGWQNNYGSVSVAASTTQCYSGKGSLALNISGTGNPGVEDTSNLYGLTAGSAVTYHVWAPTGTSIQVQPYATDSSYSIHYLTAQTLKAGWNTVSWTMPSTSGLYAIGLQVLNSAGWTGTLYLDDVTYARSDFEDAATDGWSVAWGSGNLSVANSTAQAFTGTHSLALSLSGGAAYPAVRSAGSQPGLTSGVTVYYRVYLPAGTPTIQAEPFATDDNWNQTFGTAQTLTQGWNTIAYTWPLSDGGQGAGLQINNGSGWTGSLYLDSVIW